MNWAAVARRAHTTEPDGLPVAVRALCTLDVDGARVIAAGDEAGRVRLWDPATEHETRVIEGHQDGILALCSVDLEGRAALVSAGQDRAVRLWDPATGAALRTLEGHTDAVRAVCPVDVGGRTGSPEFRVVALAPRPHLLVKLWQASHPTLGERIDFANDYRPWERGEPLLYGHLFK